VGSDHQLLLAEFKMKLCKTDQKEHNRTLNVSRLTDSQTKEHYQTFLETKCEQLVIKESDTEQEFYIETEWEKIKESIQTAAIQTLSYKRICTEKEWLLETKELNAERSQLKTTRKDDHQRRKHYNCLYRQIRNAKTDKEKYITKICEDIEAKKKHN